MIPNLSHVTPAASHAVATALAPKGHSMAGTSKAVATTSKSTAAASSNATPAATSTSANSASTITGNDFLTLLVSELKSQDPTQPTDPNTYITQLVGVNSLEQLISINTGITNLDTAAGAVSHTAPSNPAQS